MRKTEIARDFSSFLPLDYRSSIDPFSIFFEPRVQTIERIDIFTHLWYSNKKKAEA